MHASARWHFWKWGPWRRAVAQCWVPRSSELGFRLTSVKTSYCTSCISPSTLAPMHRRSRPAFAGNSAAPSTLILLTLSWLLMQVLSAATLSPAAQGFGVTRRVSTALALSNQVGPVVPLYLCLALRFGWSASASSVRCTDISYWLVVAACKGCGDSIGSRWRDKHKSTSH
jgi:hypothetical protein